MGTVKTLALDFDGVLHAYTSPWTNAHTISDGPVPGALEFLLKALRFFNEVAIYSARSKTWRGRKAMRDWLRAELAMYFLRKVPVRVLSADVHGDQLNRIMMLVKRLNITFPKHKPPAVVTLDDRAVTFTGTFPDPQELIEFRPWNKPKIEQPAQKETDA